MSLLPLCHCKCGEFYDDYVRFPRMLNCGHTLCDDCLRSLFELASPSKPLCSECKETIDYESAQDVPINRSILDINAENEALSKISIISTSTDEIEIIDKCTKHVDEIADKWCNSCQEWLCAICISNENEDHLKMILPKNKALDKINEQSSEKKSYISTKVLETYIESHKKNVDIEKGIQNSKLMKQWHDDQSLLIDKTIKELEEVKSKSDRVNNVLREREMIISYDYTDLNKTKSIWDHSKLNKKLRDSFKKVQKLIDDAESQFQIIDSLLNKCDAQTKIVPSMLKEVKETQTDITGPSDIKDNLEDQERLIYVESFEDLTLIAVKEMDCRKFYAKIVIDGKKKEIHSLSSELPPNNSIFTKYDDTYTNFIDNSTQGFIRLQLGNCSNETIRFRFSSDKTSGVLNFVKLLIGKVSGRSYKGLKLDMSNGGMSCDHYRQMEDEGTAKPLVDFQVEEMTDLTKPFPGDIILSYKGKSYPDYHSKFVIMSEGGDFNKEALIGNVLSPDLPQLKKCREHIQNKHAGDIVINECGIIRS